MIELCALGEWAYLARLPSESAAAGWARAVRELGLEGVVEVVAAYCSAAVYIDPATGDPAGVLEVLREIVPVGAEEEEEAEGRLITIPVLYDGLDLAEVSGRLGMTEGQVVNLHAGREYRVFAVGFLPGFPYCGYLPEELAGLPRRESPRVRVEAGAVAIAGRQTGIYPCASPGGWHLVGRTPLSIVDLAAERFPIRAGDRVVFEPIGPEEFEAKRGREL